MSNCSWSIYRIRKRRQKLADRLTAGSSGHLEWNAANEVIRSSTGPAGSDGFCIQSDASLATSWWDGNSHELLFNSSDFGFPPLVGLISMYEDGNLFLHVDVFSDTNSNGGYFNLYVERWKSMFYGKMRLLCWTTSCGRYIQWRSKQTVLFEVWQGRLFRVVVFNAQLIRNNSLIILNSLISYTEPFRGNFIDQCLFPFLRVYHQCHCNWWRWFFCYAES